MKKNLVITIAMLILLLVCASCRAATEEDVEKADGYVSPTDVSPTDLEEEQGVAVVPYVREDGVGVYYGSGAGLGRLTVSAEYLDDVIVGDLSPAGLAFPELPEVPGFPVLVNPYPSGMGGPMYQITPEMLIDMENNLTRFLELLYGEWDTDQYPLQYNENTFHSYNRQEGKEEYYTHKNPWVEIDDIRISAYPSSLRVNPETSIQDIFSLLPDGDLRQNPLLAAALDYMGIDDYLVEYTVEYAMDGKISRYSYCISEKTADSSQSTLNREFRNIGVTFTPEGNYLSVSLGESNYPSVDTDLPVISLTQALDKVERFFPDLERQKIKVRVHYMAHIREEYLIPCWELYVPTAERAADGTPLYVQLWVPTVDTAALD